MATLDKLSIVQTSGNTGIGSAFLDFKNITGAILCPKGYEVDVTDLQTNLLADVMQTNKGKRIYPFYDFVAPKDSTEDKVIQTFPTGAKFPVREGYNDWSFQYIDGGLTLHTQARKFNGKGRDFLFIDAENKIMGIQGSGPSKLRAIPCDGGYFWANPWKVNDASKVTEYMLQFVFNVKYSNDFVHFVKADFDVASTVYGLKNVTVSAETGGTPGTYKVTLLDAMKESLANTYTTEFTGLPALIKASNSATGGAITISSVTLGTDSKGNACYVCALLTSDTDYPASGSIDFDLDTPTALNTAGVLGYESTGKATVAKN